MLPLMPSDYNSEVGRSLHIDVNGICIREAQSLKDHATIVTLLGELVDELGNEASAQQVRSRLDADTAHALSTDNICFFIAERGTSPVALARADILHNDPVFRLRADQRCGYVDQMYVRPAYRSMGLGRALLKQCEAWFRDHHIAHCILHAAPKAAQFYARLGYQPNREMFKKL